MLQVFYQLLKVPNNLAFVFLFKNDEYVINGEKIYITNASFSNTITVTAVNGKDSRGKNMISAFIVPTKLKGLTITSYYDKMRVRGSYTTLIDLKLVVFSNDVPL